MALPHLQHRGALLGDPASGTNFLGRSLGSLPDFTFQPERFNPNAVYLARPRQAPRRAERDADPPGLLNRLERDCATPIMRINLLPSHAREVRLHVIADPSWRCIVLFRRNFLAVHSSQLTSNQTGGRHAAAERRGGRGWQLGRHAARRYGNGLTGRPVGEAAA